jgi:hypothetical protein
MCKCNLYLLHPHGHGKLIPIWFRHQPAYTKSKSLDNNDQLPLPIHRPGGMFNSPARPIKGTPKRVAGSIASRAPRPPSVFSEREREHEAIPPPSTARTNRLAQLRRDRDESPSTSVAETIRTVREVEGYEKVSWSRDDRRAVNSLGALPKEVNHLIQGLSERHSIKTCWSTADGTGGDANLVNGVVDTVSGYAMVVSSAGCKAWNYVKVSFRNCTGRSDQVLTRTSVLTHLRHATPSPRLLLVVDRMGPTMF